MKNLPYYFLSVAVLQGLVGMCLGVYMGITQNESLVSAHAHNNLLGWVSMAIFGLYYALVPEVAGKRLTVIHFWVALAGNIILPIGIWMVTSGQGDTITIIGSLLTIANLLIFGINVWTNRGALARVTQR